MRVLRVPAVAIALMLFPSMAAAEDSKPAPFLAADVHPSPQRLHTRFREAIHGDRLTVRDATMLNLVSESFHVDPTNVFGGPQWLAFTRFDITAKLPPGASPEAFKPMTQALLQDRFKLVARPEVRDLPAFLLTATKNVKLKPPTSGDSGCHIEQTRNGAGMSFKLSCKNTTMATVVEIVHDFGAPKITHPVVDQTGLKDAYDFDVQWTWDPSNQSGVLDVAQLVDQLGLKLTPGTAALPVVTVVSVNETPTPNVADIDKVLPPSPPAQFDVAVIRPANPGEKNFRMNIEGSSVAIQFATLQTLISRAYDTNRMANQPPFLNTQHFDINGKVATDTDVLTPGKPPQLDDDDVNEMLRSLLIDRFKLVTHKGTQPMDVFALVATNPKMKKSTAQDHPDCAEGPGPDGKDPRMTNPLLNRLITCHNITMAELSDRLRTLASGYVPSPVIDETKLDGAYDFTLSFSKKGDDTKTLARPTVNGETEGASDPTLGGMSLNDAMQKQLGLKLEKRSQVPQPVLVIDHVEQNPTEN